MNFQDYGLMPETDDQKWAAIRTIRNRLLQGCDWTQLADAPLTLLEKQDWATYRQALRDLPEDFGSPDDVVLPEPPSEIHQGSMAQSGGEL